MRVAIIHTWNSSGDISDRVWNALGHVWPNAARFTSDLWSTQFQRSAEPQLNSAPRRSRALGESHLRRDQLLSRLPRDLDCHAALLEGYDLVISTSPTAARQITAKSDGMHVCFLTTDAMTGPEGEGSGSPLKVSSDQMLAGQMRAGLSSQLRQALRLPKVWEQNSRGLPSSHSGVTHYFTATHAIAAQYHVDMVEQPHAVLYPPVDTTFFRPGPEVRENFLLLVCHPGIETHVQLAIEACEAAHRDLVILGGNPLVLNRESESTESHPAPASGRFLSPHVRWEPLPEDLGLRDYYRHCRAVLSLSTTGFDPSLVEAQACGTPVIAFHHAANEEIVLDAERSGLGTGVYFHSLTTASLVSAIQELERRPQNISPVLCLGQATKFSPAHFEHSLLHHLGCWSAGQSALSLHSTLDQTGAYREEGFRRLRSAA